MIKGAYPLPEGQMFRTRVIESSLQGLRDVRVQAEVERARIIEHPQQCLHGKSSGAMGVKVDNHTQV